MFICVLLNVHVGVTKWQHTLNGNTPVCDVYVRVTNFVTVNMSMFVWILVTAY